MTYRTLQGQIAYRPTNPRAIALFSGALGAYLESNASNAIDRGHNEAALRTCQDWLLAHNPAFNKNHVRRNLQVPEPLPQVVLPTESEEVRPINRPDLVMNPSRYPPEVRDEDYRYYRLTIGEIAVTSSEGDPVQLYQTDPDVELLQFPHLFPYGRGNWRRGRDEDYVTRQFDAKKKLCGLDSRFRDDHYYPPWTYQMMEQIRIHQNNQRLINGRTRQNIDNRLPDHQLLQRSKYGIQSIINEDLSFSLPAFIRTGLDYFL